MVFDEHIEKMTQCRMSITKLTLNEDIDPDLEKKLREIMQNGKVDLF